MACCEPFGGPKYGNKVDSDDMEARRLENAVWRLYQKERSQSDLSCLGDDCRSAKDVTSDVSFRQKAQNAIGAKLTFTDIRFDQKERLCEYDDLPTFPLRPNFAGFKNKLQPASECVVFDGCPEDPYHPSNTPIYQTATFVQPSANEFGPYDYSRSGNPTRTALEKHVAMLEQAAAAFAFASGMAALHTVTRLLKCGDEVIANEDIYGGMHRLLTQDCSHNGVEVNFVDTTDLEALSKAITPRTRLIHLESPSNPRMRITDLRGVCSIAHKHGILVSVDSTMMPPVICKPLGLGVDIVIHSATKFFSGHADCTGGLVCVRDPELAHRVAFLQNAEGTALAPFECFLFLRGIKTMFLRVDRAQKNARQVTSFLLKSPYIQKVFFPGPGGCDPKSLAIHLSQSSGSGSVISFTTGSVDFSRRLVNACKIFKTTVSFGSVNSLLEMPCTMSHASIPAEKRTLPEDLVRLSVGIEDHLDLIADLDQALQVAAGQLVQSPHAGFDSEFQDLPVVPFVGQHSRGQEDELSTHEPPTGPGSTPGESHSDSASAIEEHGGTFSRKQTSSYSRDRSRDEVLGGLCSTSQLVPALYGALAAGGVAAILWRVLPRK
eukprot:TRINITY_DN75704_c0_g1_i1.p1 TRINITY_DN75704_c0_g1~~TRINITY_DN75704_c0_g1_i1.p1  ORF type:complete len:634 (+),score=104.88 TRINITY_DN75704_c0_g1_i1:90-1904(+)